MNRIRCRHCGVINLEKFVTFPFCAGCGAPLPHTRKKVPVWQRPLKWLLWTTVLSLGVAGLIVAASLFDGLGNVGGKLFIYGQKPSEARVGDIVTVRFTVDAVGEEEGPREQVRKLSVRLSRALSHSFDVISLEPPSNSQEISGSGRYFHYDILPSPTQLKLTLRPLHAGRRRIHAIFSAPGHSPGDYRSSIAILPQRKKKPPLNTD